MKIIDDFYLCQPEPNKGCLLTLRDIILNMDYDIAETKKYGMPCFCYKNKMFCYLWVDKNTKEPYVLFVEGQHLNHPELEVGSRKRMKILRVNASEDIPLNTLTKLLNKAITLYKNGTIKV